MSGLERSPQAKYLRAQFEAVSAPLASLDFLQVGCLSQEGRALLSSDLMELAAKVSSPTDTKTRRETASRPQELVL